MFKKITYTFVIFFLSLNSFAQNNSGEIHGDFDLNMQSYQEDELIGAMIISRAIVAPLRRIAENAGINGPVIIEEVQQQEFEIGYNAAENRFGNMYEEGVVDPAKVTRSGLQNATSIASMILTTECIIVDEKKV